MLHWGGRGHGHSARNSALGLNPLSLSPAAWYDADRQTEAADADVQTFVDRSGNGFDLTQATLANRPLIRHLALNRRKVLEFDGVNDQLTQAGGLLNGATAGSFFIVAKTDADPAVVGSDGGHVNDFSSSTSSSHHPYSDGVVYESFGSTVRKTVGNPTDSLAAWHRYSAHSAANDFRVYLNGASIFSTATNTVGFGTMTRQLGWQLGGGYWKGLVAELLLFSRVLSTAEREQVDRYLAIRWGL